MLTSLETGLHLVCHVLARHKRDKVCLLQDFRKGMEFEALERKRTHQDHMGSHNRGPSYKSTFGRAKEDSSNFAKGMYTLHGNVSELDMPMPFISQ